MDVSAGVWGFFFHQVLFRGIRGRNEIGDI